MMQTVRTDQQTSQGPGTVSERDEREAALLLPLEARLEVARKVLRDDVRALDDAERDPGEVRDVGAERGARDAVDELV